jgi:hypothetical protein
MNKQIEARLKDLVRQALSNSDLIGKGFDTDDVKAKLTRTAEKLEGQAKVVRAIAETMPTLPKGARIALMQSERIDTGGFQEFIGINVPSRLIAVELVDLMPPAPMVLDIESETYARESLVSDGRPIAPVVFYYDEMKTPFGKMIGSKICWHWKVTDDIEVHMSAVIENEVGIDSEIKIPTGTVLTNKENDVTHSLVYWERDDDWRKHLLENEWSELIVI